MCINKNQGITQVSITVLEDERKGSVPPFSMSLVRVIMDTITFKAWNSFFLDRHRYFVADISDFCRGLLVTKGGTGGGASYYVPGHRSVSGYARDVNSAPIVDLYRNRSVLMCGGKYQIVGKLHGLAIERKVYSE